jgi:hypothetical protein
MIPPNNYQRSFPPLAPIPIKSNEVKIINDQNSLLPNSNQNEVNTPKRKQDIDNRINFLSQSLTIVANEASAANTQVITATTTFNSLNSRLSLANALPDSNPNKDTLISQIQQSMNVQQEIRLTSQSLYDRKNQEQIDLTREVQALRAERDTLV